jgi:GntR family phosphonate transport system transcriptional regulator
MAADNARRGRRPTASKGRRKATPPHGLEPDTKAGGRGSWKVVAGRIEAAIASGNYAEGTRLPAETMLTRELGVSRHTLRRAIAALETRGLIHSVPHNGVFVTPLKLSFPFGARKRFTEAIASFGLKASGQLVSQRRCLPSAYIARQLRIARRSEVIELQIVRSVSGRPLGFATIWLPAERFARIGEMFAAVGELRQAMILHGVADYRRSVLRVSARPAAEDERTMLDLEMDAVVLVVESLSRDATGEPTHVSLFRFGANRVDLVLEV